MNELVARLQQGVDRLHGVSELVLGDLGKVADKNLHRRWEWMEAGTYQSS